MALESQCNRSLRTPKCPLQRIPPSSVAVRSERWHHALGKIPISGDSWTWVPYLPTSSVNLSQVVNFLI